MLERVKGQEEGLSYLSRVVEGVATSPLLLLGPVGVGRLFSVREAVKEAFRVTELEEDCPQCYQVDKGIHPDCCVISPEDEDKDIKVEAVRDLLAESTVRPSLAPWKALIIDGVDRMTTASSNSLLKVLEEAPDTVRFFLLAEDIQGVLPTISSRCVTVRFGRLPEEFVVGKLCELTEDRAKALVYCRLAGGSVGRAVKFLSAGRLGVRDKMVGILKIGLLRDLQKLFAAIEDVGPNLPLGLLFLEHIVYDLIMLPHSTTLLTNLDIIPDLQRVRQGMGVDRIHKMRSELRGALSKCRGPYNLAFHVKSLMASVFA